jgi:hypothetical protein
LTGFVRAETERRGVNEFQQLVRTATHDARSDANVAFGGESTIPMAV